MRKCRGVTGVRIVIALLLNSIAFIGAAFAQASENHPVIVHPAIVMPQIHVPAPAPVAPAKPASAATQITPQTHSLQSVPGAAAATGQTHTAPVTQAKSATEAKPAAQQEKAKINTGSVDGLKKAGDKPADTKTSETLKTDLSKTTSYGPATPAQTKADLKLKTAQQEFLLAEKSGDKKAIAKAEQKLKSASAEADTANQEARSVAHAKALADLRAAKKQLNEAMEPLHYEGGKDQIKDIAAARAALANALAEVDATADPKARISDAQAKAQADIADAQKLLSTAEQPKSAADAATIANDKAETKSDKSQIKDDENAVRQDEQAAAAGNSVPGKLDADLKQEAADKAKSQTDRAQLKTDESMDAGTRVKQDEATLKKDEGTAFYADKGNAARATDDKVRQDRQKLVADEKKQHDIQKKEENVALEITGLKVDVDLGKSTDQAEKHLKSDEKELDKLLGIPDPDAAIPASGPDGKKQKID